MFRNICFRARNLIELSDRTHVPRQINLHNGAISRRNLSDNLPETEQRTKNDLGPRASQEPVKFTTSKAHLDYKAVRNFYGGEPIDTPKSHNLVITASLVFGLFYCIFIREDIDDNEGWAGLVKPVHELVPETAIPMLEAAIVENQRFGHDTSKLRAQLEVYKKREAERDKKRPRPKMIEN